MDIYRKLFRRIDATTLRDTAVARVTPADLRTFLDDEHLTDRGNVVQLFAKVFNAAADEGITLVQPEPRAHPERPGFAEFLRHGTTPSSSISIEKPRNVRTSTTTPSVTALSSDGSIVIVWMMSAMIRTSSPSRIARPTLCRTPLKASRGRRNRSGHEPCESENRTDDEHPDPGDLEPLRTMFSIASSKVAEPIIIPPLVSPITRERRTPRRL